PAWFSAAWHWWAMRPRRHVRTSVLASPKPGQRRRRWQKRFRITITSTGLLLPTTPRASRSVNASSRTRASLGMQLGVGIESDDDRRLAKLLQSPKGILDWIAVPNFLEMRP